jgi:YggT family protein
VTDLVVLALTRSDVASYVDALFTVYIVLIFARILVSWIPRPPAGGVGGSVIEFLRQTTDPYLNLFRRFLPPVGGGGMALDLSPIIGVVVLFILQAVVTGLISG